MAEDTFDGWWCREPANLGIKQDGKMYGPFFLNVKMDQT
jgi:hypothetical protein